MTGTIRFKNIHKDNAVTESFFKLINQSRINLLPKLSNRITSGITDILIQYNLRRIHNIQTV